jgi:hypothetical protein
VHDVGRLELRGKGCGRATATSHMQGHLLKEKTLQLQLAGGQLQWKQNV